MLCPKLDISTVAWHTLAFSSGHSPRLPASSSLHAAPQLSKLGCEIAPTPAVRLAWHLG